MATKQELVRSKLKSKVFDILGKTVTLIKQSSPTYNTRGELEDNTETSSSITIVPYNILYKEKTYQSFGDLEEGESEAAVPYDTVVDVDDKIVMDSQTYIITKLERNYLPENVVTIIRLSKSQD